MKFQRISMGYFKAQCYNDCIKRPEDKRTVKMYWKGKGKNEKNEKVCKPYAVTFNDFFSWSGSRASVFC